MNGKIGLQITNGNTNRIRNYNWEFMYYLQQEWPCCIAQTTDMDIASIYSVTL